MSDQELYKAVALQSSGYIVWAGDDKVNGGGWFGIKPSTRVFPVIQAAAVDNALVLNTRTDEAFFVSRDLYSHVSEAAAEARNIWRSLSHSQRVAAMQRAQAFIDHHHIQLTEPGAAPKEPDFLTAASAMGIRLALLGKYGNGDVSIGLSIPVGISESKTYLAYRAVEGSIPGLYSVYYPKNGIWQKADEGLASGVHAAVAQARVHWNALSIKAGEELLREAYTLDRAMTTQMTPRVGGPLTYDNLDTTTSTPKYQNTKDPEVKKPEDRPCHEPGGPALWMKIFAKEFGARLGENTRFKFIYDYSGPELLLYVRLDDFHWQARVQSTCMPTLLFDSFLRTYGRFAFLRDGALK